MKKEFSKHWKASKKPRKQRKYQANAPLHKRKEFTSVSLSKELRKKHGTRNLPLRKNDNVKIMRGKYKGKKGKVLSVDSKELKVEIEGIQVQKKDGSKVNVKLKPSNLQITELNEDDNKRIKKNQTKSEQKNTKKSEKSETKTKSASESGKEKK